MTPGTLTVPFYRGARYAHRLTLTNTSDGSPLDLTGLGPFVFTVKNARNGIVIANATVASDYDATGVIDVEILAAVTDRFPLGEDSVTVGMRDNDNNPYIQSTVDVLPFTPEPRAL